jgi:penicillin-binding protein 1C
MASSAKLPPLLKRFQPGRLAGEGAQPPLHILFPPDGARLDLSATDGKPDAVPLKVAGAVGALTVLVNGVPVAADGSGTPFFKPDGPGFSRVTVLDSSGAAASVVVRVDDGSASRGMLGAASAACTLSPCEQSVGSSIPR